MIYYKYNSVFFIVLVYIFFGYYLCSSHSTKSKQWSYFVFSQQWPPAACLDVPHGKCSIPEGVVNWTIHGLWPTSDVGYPSFCNSSWPFKPASLKTILQALEVKWPNIYAGTPQTSFWKHEWLKHGTCATNLTNFNTELKYFKRSLELHDALNIFELIEMAGISPNESQPIPLKYIEHAITSYVNKTIKIFCEHHKHFSVPVLTSMYICLDKSLQLIDCDKIQDIPCNSSYVFYLPYNNSIF